MSFQDCLKLFEETSATNEKEFTIEEAIALKHNLTISREQMRKVRHVLSKKGIYFPTTNALLEGRRKLRPVVQSTVENKGVKVPYKELIKLTTESILNIVKDKPEFERESTDTYTFTMHFKDGGDGAGQQTKFKSKKMINSKQNMFQYGLTPLKLVCKSEATNDTKILWENKAPNSAMSVRPVYLIREVETDEELLNEVISTTDKARNELNQESMVVEIDSRKLIFIFLFKAIFEK